MKVILRILVILLVATVVSSGVYALVENTSLVSSNEAERGAPPQMTDTDDASFQPMERPADGDEHGASLSRGVGEMGVLLAKISGITIIVLLVQKAAALLQNKKLKTV
ncbi:MAG: hypothetical protein IPG44_17935 [Anaerolineales bacterium]|jgi:hypothetical protein|nr:hypothetical protein [Anaerolineales bacterium]